MENNKGMADESLDSAPNETLRYEALEDEYENSGNNQAMETEDNFTEYVEEQKDADDDGGQYDSEQEMDKESENNDHNDSNVVNSHEGEPAEEEDFSLEYDEEDMCEEYAQEGLQPFVEHITADNKNIDPLIVQGNDGMIKKIKICNTSKDANEKSLNKTKKLLSTQNERINKFQARSSTPMSREYIALQKSVNDSKILTEFVTDVASEKPRKLRTKESANPLTSTADHSYSTVRKGTQVTPEKLKPDDTSFNSSISSSQGKRQHKRYAQLKDDSDVDSSAHLRPRSRSKSMHNSEINAMGSQRNLKKWPSEERLNKRTNMRSENSEFAQKQIEFMQRIIHASENPLNRSRSRSRSVGKSKSCGRKSPNSLNESVEGGGAVVQQYKSHKSSRERFSKRNKYETSLENDDHLLHLGDNGSEQPDDASINESQVSLMAVSSLGDTTTTGDNGLNDDHLKIVWQPAPKPGYDSFCWKCRANKVNLCCYKCIRSFHAACVKINKFDNFWLCPECTTTENILNNPKRSRRNELTLDMLNQLLSFALKRMRYTKGHCNFSMPYEDTTIYDKYLVNRVTLTELQKKIEAKEFRCAEEFVNETKWILHNAYILSNRNNNKTVVGAKSIFKICRQEANEIETCAECYLNANTRTDWFVDVCSQPHLLLWAKLKGFPYWPAKAMGLGPTSLVNVRFFGEHDRAFVPLKDCFLLSEQDPNMTSGKKTARVLAGCIKELGEHIEKIKSKVGGFKYAAFKTPYEPAEEIKQLTEMMPGVEDFVKNQQHGMTIKPSLQFKIYKTADNNLSIVQKASKTPELPTIMHDTEEKEKEKKKKSPSESNDGKKLEDSITTSSAKYEVVSKVSSDDSSSSKLGTVILKRKSVNGDSKKTNDDESVELPLPKMAKIEDVLGEDTNKTSAKRKIEVQNVEKLKSKHPKLELKIPIMTIKTLVAKEPAINNTNEVTTKNSEGSNTTMDVETNQQVSVVQQNIVNESPGDSQKANENMLIIKKISKHVENSKSLEQQTSLNKAKESTKESAKDKKVDKQKSEDEKAKENQKVNNILKGLVPFVEVKKEVVSDNEEEVEKTQNEKDVDKDPQTINTRNNENLQKSPETVVNNFQTSNKSTADNNSLEKRNEGDEANILLAKVKEEILSEDEATESATTSANPTITKLASISGNGNTNIEKQNSISNVGDIRLVGETTIQKVPSKNNHTQYYVYNNNSATTSNKRPTLKGIPYGPLPASAFPKSIPSRTFQPTEVSLQPRAKKSFPQSSPPLEKIRSISYQIPTTSLATQHGLDQKRTMSKNTMVAIPVDVATNRSSTSTGTIAIGSIPVPPLTAVSKTLPSILAHNSTARNSPATITVCSTSSSLTTPSVMTQAKVTTVSITTHTATIIRNSPITVTSISSMTPLTSTVSLPSAPVSSTLNPLTMSTPPPLAGLSNSCLISTTHTNGVMDLNNTTTITSSPATQPQLPTDTHLLGGLVTPTLASAITDVICRGPPKLASRPTGPLQSEGHPMFPSQAGPVCKRLVENVHKLTDFFISVVEDTMGEMAQGDDASLQAKTTLLTLELERNKQAYEQEIGELKRSSDLMLCQMRNSMENEKTRLVNDIRKQCEMERLRSVEETKRKQWCANCFREANFYCCWNTSYCDFPCQQLHWSRHSHDCTQTRPGVNEITTAPTVTTQSERHHNTKLSTSTVTLSSSSNFNKPSTVSQKKEKNVTKNSANHMMSSTIATPATTSRTNTEVLKLPSNTYLRPVTSNINSQTIRCNTTYSIPVQRFNAPMPITTPANSNNSQTYTFVQQGKNWVMSSSNNSTSVNSGNNLATNSSTLAAPIASVSQVSGQARSANNISVGSLITNKSSKTQIRYH